MFSHFTKAYRPLSDIHTVDVAVPVPLLRTFTYLVPQALVSQARAGCRVEVPFGKRTLSGVIVGPGRSTIPDDRLRPLLDVLDATPSVGWGMLQLTQWIANYYVCGWGEALRAALPKGLDRQTVVRVQVADNAPAAAIIDPLAEEILRYVRHFPGATVAGMRNAGIKAPATILRRLEEEGFIRLRKDEKGPSVRRKFQYNLTLVRTSNLQVRGRKQRAIIDVLLALQRDGNAAPDRNEVLHRADASPASLKSLVEKGVITMVRSEKIRAPLVSYPGKASTITHHSAQKAALVSIRDALTEGQYRAFLLHGVTGSGKTEVYLTALSESLARGRTGIVLVPEISLTPQTVRRFRQRFGDRVTVLHSRMSQGERYDAWRQLKDGRCHIVIGPRSAILAPLSNVGMIVVDEEHEGSYKQQEPSPRYHARDVALMRARMEKAVCILGTATPSLESLHNARSGKLTLLRMPERIPVQGGAPAAMPTIRIIDLITEQKKKRLSGSFSGSLREAIAQRLERKEQIILLQNRRGFAPFLQCMECGFVPACRDCSVTLTYHKTDRLLRCHYCLRSERVLTACPKCSAINMVQVGAGTQRVQEELETLFPSATVLRMDLDTTRRKDAHVKLLSRFESGSADILLGTQMVAKGLDFGRVTLVGVIGADIGMNLPDFRAEERTFQLLLQVAGRAGRDDLKGEVLIQTRRPDHPVFQNIISHDYVAFANTLLRERHELSYPPFTRLVSIHFRGPDEDRVMALAREHTAALREALPDSVTLLGPGASFIKRVKKQYRYQTLIKAPKHEAGLQHAVREAFSNLGRPPVPYRMFANVDPVGME